MHPLQAEAIQKAHELREKYFVDDISPLGAFRRLFADYNIELKYDIHGEDLQKDGDKYIITMPRGASDGRNAYAIACDIGLILFGRKPVQLHIQNLTAEDRQPYQFAAELLMPEEEFRRVCQEQNYRTDEVAFRFGVSEAAAGFRMAVFGLEPKG